MGNGSRLKVNGEDVDINLDSATLSLDDLEKAANAAISNFGKPIKVMMSMSSMIQVQFEWQPQWTGTPWANIMRPTKREKMIANLHTTLHKLGTLKGLDEETFENIKSTSIKRLKRARWAKYQQKKVESPG